MLLKEVPDERLYDLLLSDGLVFAYTPWGLYRGTVAKKQWEKIDFPGDLKLGLTFEDEESKGPDIYVITRKKLGDPVKHTVMEAQDAGLYISSDKGNTWQYQNGDYEFHQVLQLDGKLYGIVQRDGEAFNNPVMVSEDKGKTWKNLTTPESRAYRIFPDPDHPGLICMMVSGGRTFIHQAADANYKWRAVPEWNFSGLLQPPFTQQLMFSVQLGIAPSQAATLKNYFTEDFGKQAYRPGLLLTVNSPKYVFKKGSPMMMEATVKCVSQDWPVDLLDNKQAPDFWHIEVAGSEAKNRNFDKWLGPLQGGFHDNEARAEAGREYRAAHKVITNALKEGSTYKRKIDLRALGISQQPGMYRYRLYYGSGWISPTLLDPERKHEFYGRLGTQEFTVEIKG